MTYSVPAGGAIVEEDVLIAAGAVGTMRIACSAPVTVAARIQVSADGGKTFDEGRIYSGLDEAGAFRDERTVSATSDLLVAEIAGSTVAFEALVTNEYDAVLGRRSYELPAFAQQIVNLAEARKNTTTPLVKIRIISGNGALVFGEETRDPDTRRMTMRHRRPPDPSTTAIPAAQEPRTGAKATRELVASPFQAAPFREPATGLDFFRSRWYDPRTGTFMTPDPMGHRDSTNLYTFAGGDPVNHRDPTGLYQEDIHYYATYYLARIAGFASQEARQIAYAAQYVDDDSYTDPIKNAAPLPGSNKARGEGMHFAHSPQSFVVDENNSVARNAVTEAARSLDLTRLGVSLHTLEDSFSHAGFNYEHGSHNRRTGSARPNLGHGDAADGGHRPDIPSRDPAKAHRMTAAVLQALQGAYRQIYGTDPPKYRKFDISLIYQDVDFAIRSGALPPNRSANAFEMGRSHAERVATWRAIIKSQLGDDVLYEPIGPPPGFIHAVDAHVREVQSQMR